jgi:hypothetical protein
MNSQQIEVAGIVGDNLLAGCPDHCRLKAWDRPPRLRSEATKNFTR